jgi:hypothetical protein
MRKRDKKRSYKYFPENTNVIAEIKPQKRMSSGASGGDQ